MTQRFNWRISPLLLIILFISACSGLAGEIEIIETLPPPTSAQTFDANNPEMLPSVKPDIANGQRIFLENCTRCHGENGAGGGELVESGEVPRMPSFLEGSYIRQQSPADYYNIITNGNLINLMPPWADALSMQERWDVALYVYTLHYDPEQIAQVAAKYASASESFSPESDHALLTTVEQESGLIGEEAWTAVAYRRVRSLRNYALLNGIEIAGTENNAPPPESLTISGTVTHGTAGFSVPAGLPVYLRYGDLREGLETLETQLDSSATYRFDEVPYASHYIYSVVVGYQERGFLSDVLVAQDASEINDLPITLYETIGDPNIVKLEDVSLTIDVTVVDGLGSGLIIWQKNIYRNDSDRMVYLTPPNQDVSVSVLVQLPPGSIILNDDQDPRYISIRQDTPMIIDTLPVYPGEHVVDIAYFLPYEDGAVIDLPLNNQFDGTVSIKMLIPQLEIAGTGIEAVVDPVSNEQSSSTKEYQGVFSLNPNQSIVFEITGALFGSSNTSDDSSLITGDSLLPLLIVIGVVFTVAIGGVVFLQQRAGRSIQDEMNRLVAQIAELEDLHESGQINHDVFQRQRQELKSKLAAIMTQNIQSPDK